MLVAVLNSHFLLFIVLCEVYGSIVPIFGRTTVQLHATAQFVMYSAVSHESAVSAVHT